MESLLINSHYYPRFTHKTHNFSTVTPSLAGLVSVDRITSPTVLLATWLVMTRMAPYTTPTSWSVPPLTWHFCAITLTTHIYHSTPGTHPSTDDILLDDTAHENILMGLPWYPIKIWAQNDMDGISTFPQSCFKAIWNV